MVKKLYICCVNMYLIQKIIWYKKNNPNEKYFLKTRHLIYYNKLTRVIHYACHCETGLIKSTIKQIYYREKNEKNVAWSATRTAHVEITSSLNKEKNKNATQLRSRPGRLLTVRRKISVISLPRLWPGCFLVCPMQWRLL